MFDFFKSYKPMTETEKNFMAGLRNLDPAERNLIKSQMAAFPTSEEYPKDADTREILEIMQNEAEQEKYTSLYDDFREDLERIESMLEF